MEEIQERVYNGRVTQDGAGGIKFNVGRGGVDGREDWERKDEKQKDFVQWRTYDLLTEDIIPKTNRLRDGESYN